MKCPKCESDNTQRLEMVFTGGTQSINTTGHAAAAGSLSGALGWGGAVTKTTGQSQSMLAQKLAPPQKQDTTWPSLAILFGLINFVFGLNHGVMVALLSLLIFSGGGAHFYLARKKFNKDEWPKLYQHWLESWVCHKCGGIYHQA